MPVRQSGSHMILRNQEGNRITLPRHDPIGKGLLMEIIAEAGITKDEFLRLL
jgi:predicted RNA binding protein YcfA (HicA-like mRNA interferase family)